MSHDNTKTLPHTSPKNLVSVLLLFNPFAAVVDFSRIEAERRIRLWSNWTQTLNSSLVWRRERSKPKIECSRGNSWSLQLFWSTFQCEFTNIWPNLSVQLRCNVRNTWSEHWALHKRADFQAIRPLCIGKWPWMVQGTSLCSRRLFLSEFLSLLLFIL